MEIPCPAVNPPGGSCNTVIAHWDLENCYSDLGNGSNNDYSEFTPSLTTPTECGGSTMASIVYRNNGTHSCTPGVSGSVGMCVGTRSGCDFLNDDQYALRFDVTVKPTSGGTATLSGLSFYEKAPSQYNWIGGASGNNNYPTKYGIRVTVNGQQVFKQTGISTSQYWSLESFDFLNDPDFTVTSNTTFSFELRAYCRVGNGASQAVWDIDEIKAFGCCDGPCANAGGDSDGDGVCDNDDCAPNNPNLPTTPGTACNDGNPNTVNDVIQADGCTCAGTFDPCANAGGDSDGDGVCDNDDCAPNNPNLPTTPGTACNDGNPNTVNDVIQADGCTCAGTFDSCATQGGDSDGDGVCDNDDCAPNNPNLPTTPGTACNDGNPNTVNDVIQADGCTCAGTFDPCANAGGDSDGDGVCDNDDCAPNNPNLPTTPGIACNDGNPNTVNDVIQADGCTCAGTPPVCDNIILGGTIGFGANCNGSATVCNAPVSMIENCASPSGGSGAMEILWLKANNNPTCAPPSTTIANIANDPLWSIIPSETGLTLNPGTISQKTCYLRCTRRAGCDMYMESNIIMADLDPNCGGGGDPNCDTDITITAGNGSITVSGLDGAPVSSMQIFTSDWTQQLANCFANCGATQTVNVPAGDYIVFAKYYTAGYQLICQRQENVTVGGGGGPCANAGGDSDGDGVCNDDDCTPNNANLPATPGTACNDGNPNTTNDMIQADGCTCAGTPVNDPCANAGGDSDGDGVCNNDDCAPNDSSLPASPGTACNDGNTNTNNDVIQADGCTCAGTPGGGGDPNCDTDITITTSNGTITVSGLDGAPISSMQIFTSDWTQQLANCFANCGATQTVNVPAGDYIVFAKYYTVGYQLICQRQENVTIGGGDPCANAGGDSDGDGVCDNDDCAPNNANLPATPGTACNDGNANTNNDMIQADGCTCAGTPINDPCANAGGDSDGDGVCNNDDCAPNDASLPTSPGTACNDGNANTNNDVIQADGCTCAGTPGGGGDPNCDTDITITTGNGSITVSGLDGAPVSSMQIFTSDWTQQFFNCFANCGATETVNVPAGDYIVFAKYYTAGYQLICQRQENVTIGGSDPCANAGGDSDGDGVCDNDDCQPNDPAFPATPGTACNDGNPNTNNDVIQGDGCSCVGTPVNTGCTPTELVRYSMSACHSCQGSSDSDWSELTAAITSNGNCQSATATSIAPTTNGATHSCTSGASGNAMCVGQGTTVQFSVTINGNGTNRLSGISFYEQAPNNYYWETVGCGGPVSGQNNKPTKFDLKVYKGNNLVFSTTMNTQTSWNLRTVDFSSDPDFEVSGSATYTFKFTPHSATGYGSVKAWDLDEIRIMGCCGNGDPCADAGGDSDGDGVCNNQDCAPFNANLPAIPSTACNDGNPNTINDVIQGDGCSCAGTPVQVCDNITYGGTIGFGNSCSASTIVCNADVPTINNCASPTGGSGAMENIWLKAVNNPNCFPPSTTIENIDNDPYWSIIPGQTGLTLTPGTITTKTCYLRCTRRAGCSTYIESNIIMADLDPNCGGGGGTDCNNISISASPGSISISGLDGAPITSLQVFSSDWAQVFFTCYGDCNATETVNLTAGSYIVLAKYYNASWMPQCEVSQTVNVVNALAANGQFNFEVAKEDEHAEIIWVHNKGEQVENYVVEHSLDGRVFEAIADHLSKGGTQAELYHAYDFAPAKGDNYYRIKMNLTDGTVDYSAVRKIQYADLIDFVLFPNPANDFVKVNLEEVLGSEDVSISIYNNLGVAVKVFELEEVYSKYYQMDIRSLHEGHYIVWLKVPGRKPLAKQLMVGKI